MKVLGIETSGSAGGFAVADETGLIAEVTADIMGHHLERGFDMIESILAGTGLGVHELGGVAVSLGPGSFTGLRVGLALAKGLCFGRGLALAGVPTLDCMAEGLASFEGLLVPVRDARRGEVYFSVYEAHRGGLARLSPYRALVPEALVGALNGDTALFREQHPITLAGDGLVKYGEILRSGLGKRASLAPETLWDAKPGIVAAEGLRLIREGKVADLDTLEPIYVRASEAERQAAGRVLRGTDRDKKNERR